MPEMNEGIGSPLPVKRRTADTLKAHMSVKSQCVRILLIHIKCELQTYLRQISMTCGKS